MEDKRIYKTKKNLRTCLLNLLKEKPFAKITVKEICEKASTSRITFYTHYEDKYDLLEDLFEEQESYMLESFENLQRENNKQDDPSISFQNMVKAFMDMHYQLGTPFNMSVDNLSSEIVLCYYRFITKNLHDLEVRYQNILLPRYSSTQVNALLALGLWAFFHTGTENKKDYETLTQETQQVIQDLIDSNLFVHS